MPTRQPIYFAVALALSALLPVAAYAAMPLGARTAALISDEEDEDGSSVVLDPEEGGLGYAFSAGGRSFATINAALEAAGDGGMVSLLRDVSLADRIDLDADAVFDLGGWTLSSSARWLVNVGDNALVVSNGCVVASDCGFYVNDGSLWLEKCDVSAYRRVAQVRGAGTVHVARNARLETTGEDPVIFAIGGISGRAAVESFGTLVQSFADGEDTTAYDIAGNPDDTFGADFTLAGAGGAYFAQSSDANVHHPEGQGGDVLISGGWFSMRPPDEWLAPDFGSRPRRLDVWDGWQVFLKAFSVRIR